MFGRSCGFAALLVLAGCTAVQPVPSAERTLEIFVNYTSGGVWPTGVSARIYSDGVLTLGDGASQVRRPVSATHPTFVRIRNVLESPSFREELGAAAVPSQEWRSSGSWIRIEREMTVALIKPPVEQPHIRSALEEINSLFAEAFGRRYRAIAVK